MTDAEVPTQVVEPVEPIADTVAGNEQVAEEPKQSDNEGEAQPSAQSQEEPGANNEPAESEQPETDGSAPAKPLPMLETTGRQQGKRYNKDELPITDDPEEIRKQVEFYFSDNNLPQDKFLYDQTGGPLNKPIKVSVVASFRRMKRFQPTSAIVPALKESDKLVIEGPEGEETVRRTTPYEPMNRQELEHATVYIKGFGDEEDGTQSRLESFFGQYEGVDGVRMRREKYNGAFKGSVWIQFRTKESADKFLALEPQPTWMGHELMIKSKSQYCQEKSELIEQGKLKPQFGNNHRRYWEGSELSRGRGGRGRGRGNFRGNDRNGGDRNRGDRNRGNNRGRGRGRGGHFNGERKKTDAPRDATHDSRPQPEAKETNGKRARDEDGGAEAPAAKKVDTKSVEVGV